MAALMMIDMRDPASIAAWVRIAPERHWPQLKAIVRVHPQRREAARKAQALLKLASSPHVAA